ncbi:hypothetical protein CR513_50217, partial [Mucuna pruriens]
RCEKTSAENNIIRLLFFDPHPWHDPKIQTTLLRCQLIFAQVLASPRMSSSTIPMARAPVAAVTPHMAAALTSVGWRRSFAGKPAIFSNLKSQISSAKGTLGAQLQFQLILKRSENYHFNNLIFSLKSI